MTSIQLPAFKDTDGNWRPAIRLSPELIEPVAEAVLSCLVEQGLAKQRFGWQAGTVFR